MESTKRRAKPKTKKPAPFITIDKKTSEVGLLLRRAGFGAPLAGVRTAAKKGLHWNINHLVDYESTPDTFTPPDSSVISMDKTAKIDGLTVWWLNRMLTTNRPLQEKMTLFWHGHFATAIQKVRYPAFMYQQNQLFRDNALGRFDDLLTGVYKDPSMLIWLDGTRNTKAAPNENFGREVMELFTLGHGNYTENDVHAGAKAFTGWRVMPDGSVTFVPRLHDDSVKTYLGKTGNWGADDAVRILAAHPATGHFLATKLWRFFASDTPPASAINKMAAVYYRSGHSIREMVRIMFSAPEFYSKEVRVGHIKSPTEFVVTSLRELGLTNVDLTTVPRTLAFLGQDLFNPPNVGGWPGGATWVNASTMLGRFNFASGLTGDRVQVGMGIDTSAIVTQSRASRMDQLLDYLAANLGVTLGSSTKSALLGYGGKGSVTADGADVKIQGLLHLLLVSPEYQVS